MSSSRLIELLGVRGEIRSSVRAIARRHYKATLPDGWEKRVDARIPWNEFETSIAAVIEERFSDTEIKALCRWLERPLARKFMSRMVEMDSIMADLSMRIGEGIAAALELEST